MAQKLTSRSRRISTPLVMSLSSVPHRLCHYHLACSFRHPETVPSTCCRWWLRPDLINRELPDCNIIFNSTHGFKYMFFYGGLEGCRYLMVWQSPKGWTIHCPRQRQNLLPNFIRTLPKIDKTDLRRLWIGFKVSETAVLTIAIVSSMVWRVLKPRLKSLAPVPTTLTPVCSFSRSRLPTIAACRRCGYDSDTEWAAVTDDDMPPTTPRRLYAIRTSPSTLNVALSKSVG